MILDETRYNNANILTKDVLYLLSYISAVLVRK